MTEDTFAARLRAAADAADAAERLRGPAEGMELANALSQLLPENRLELLADLFAILAEEGLGVASGPNFIAHEGLAEFAAVRMEMLVGLRDDDTERGDR